MPQIPIATRPDMGFSQPASQVDNGGGWSALPSNFSQFGGPSVADGIFSGLANALGPVGNAIYDYAKKKQDAEDYNAIAEAKRLARTAYETHQEDLRNRVDYENFNTSLQDVNKNVEEQLKPILEKASGHAQMIIQNDIADMASGMSVLTTATANQRHTTQLRGNSEDRIKFYADTGNYDEAKKEVDNSIAVGLFHAGDKDRLYRGIDERQTFNSVKSMMDEAGDPYKISEIKDNLKAKDDKGNFTNFKNLDINARMDFLKHAETKSNILEAQIKDDIVNQFISGKRVDDKTINSLPIDQRLKNSLLNMGKQMDKEILKEGVEQNKLAGQNVHDSIYLTLTTMPWASNEADRTATFNKLGTEILTREDLDPKQKQSLYAHLQSLYKASGKPESLENNDVYQAINKKIQKAYSDKALYIDPPGLWNKKSDPETQEANFVKLQQNWRTMVQKNPNISIEQAQTWYNNSISEANAGTLKKIFSDKFSPLSTRENKPIFNAFDSMKGK